MFFDVLILYGDFLLLSVYMKEMRESVLASKTYLSDGNDQGRTTTAFDGVYRPHFADQLAIR